MLLDEILSELERYRQMGYAIPHPSIIKTPEQIDGIRESGRITTEILDLLEKEVRPGMTTAQIDKLVYEYTTDHNAIPAPLNYNGFPKSVCTSINNVVCHGIPSEKTVLKPGDIVNIDVSTILNGYFSDASRMYLIGEVSPEAKRLTEITRQ